MKTTHVPYGIKLRSKRYIKTIQKNAHEIESIIDRSESIDGIRHESSIIRFHFIHNLRSSFSQFIRIKLSIQHHASISTMFGLAQIEYRNKMNKKFMRYHR